MAPHNASGTGELPGRRRRSVRRAPRAAKTLGASPLLLRECEDEERGPIARYRAGPERRVRLADEGTPAGRCGDVLSAGDRISDRGTAMSRAGRKTPQA